MRKQTRSTGAFLVWEVKVKKVNLKVTKPHFRSWDYDYAGHSYQLSRDLMDSPGISPIFRACPGKTRDFHSQHVHMVLCIVCNYLPDTDNLSYSYSCSSLILVMTKYPRKRQGLCRWESEWMSCNMSSSTMYTAGFWKFWVWVSGKLTIIQGICPWIWFLWWLFRATSFHFISILIPFYFHPTSILLPSYFHPTSILLSTCKNDSPTHVGGCNGCGMWCQVL